MTWDRTLGAQIRRLRLLQDLTLKQVEQKAKVSATHISELERGATSPTVGALAAIAGALGARPSDFFTPVRPRAPAVQRAGRCRAWRDERSGVLIRSLGGGNTATILDIRFPHPRDEDPAWDAPPGETFVHVVDGKLRITDSATRVFEVASGDSLHVYLSDSSFAESANGAARGIWTVRPALNL